MKVLTKHLIALLISTMIAAPIFALNGIYGESAAGRIPWLAGSVFISAMWAMFMAVLVSAPVATISIYIIEHRFWVKWPMEPLIVFGVLSAFCGPVCLYAFGWSLPMATAVVVSLYFPCLIYFLLLRAIGIREYI